MESLGAYVAQRRRSLGLTQQALADSLGYSVQAISKFEKGSSQMDLSSLPNLASALSLSLDELLKEKEHQEGQVCSFAFDGKILAANLAYLRAKKGLTQNEAGALAHISARSLANYEKGLFLPSLSTVLVYLDYYGISADELFGKSLAPVAEVVVTPKKHHPWRWLTPLIACLVAAIVIGSTSPLWAFSSSSPSSSEESASTETLSVTTDNVDDITSVTGLVDKASDATLKPGVYPLHVNIEPESWYTDDKFDQIGWVVSNADSTNTDGAEVRSIASDHAWYLIVNYSCNDGGVFVLRPYVKSLISSSRDRYFNNPLRITFANPPTPATSVYDGFAGLLTLEVKINGETSVTLAPNSTVTADVIPTPSTWAGLSNYTISGNGASYEGFSSSSHIGVAKGSDFFHLTITVDAEATSLDRMSERISFWDSRNDTFVNSLNYLTVAVS
jgi:transcriptional regulator with XRE-family HTH domain